MSSTCGYGYNLTWLPGPCGPGYDPPGSASPWLSGGTTPAGCSTCNRRTPSWKVTRRIMFWRSKHFNQYFLCMRWWFSKPFKNFSFPYKINKFLFASLKLLTNFEKAYWMKSSSKFPSLIGQCPVVHEKCARNHLSHAASGRILQNQITGGSFCQ
jgi:hypothetical protein